MSVGSVSFSSASARGVRELGSLVGRSVHGVDHRHQRVTALAEDAAPFGDVVAVEPYHKGLGRLVPQQVQGTDDPVGDLVAGGDATEDVDEDALDLLVAE